MSNQKFNGLEIAIVGMSCRFPGASNWKEYWENLKNGTESIDFLSDQELQGMGVSLETMRDENFVNAVTRLKNKQFFDSGFFDYRPTEAALMNPLHRICHECVWEALEDAGIDPERAKGQIGLYIGGGEDLHWRLYSKLKNLNQEIDDFSLYNLNSRDFLSLLLSYKLNLKGPSFTVNTTCSTSLVAVHLACKSLLLGETRTALAGGVTIKTHEQKGYFYQEGMMFSADGHCRTFDKEASGIVVSEGAGIVVLKRLNDALEDGDEIYALIKGSAINNDGNRKVGFTASSVEGQAECIRKAHRFSKVTPESIGYVETHGTGTRLGDPVEIEALNIAFGKIENHRCAIGSVKTNIGHTDAAAGVAGLIKAALSLKWKLLPASLNFKEANPDINFDGGPFYVNTELKEWLRHGDFPLRSGVSSFGIGGTNAHVILEEPPEMPVSGDGKKHKILTISAKSLSALSRYQNRLVSHLIGSNDQELADLAYTSQLGRKQFTYRQAIVFEQKEELITKLSDQQAAKAVKSESRAEKIVFMFSGQGSQYINMGKDLYLTESVFRNEMDNGFNFIRTITGESFEDILYPEKDNQPDIKNTKYAQPLIFLFEYALTKYLSSIGVTPDYMIGHSIGEYVAACISGVLSLQDALKLVIKRGELMNAMTAGAMLSVALEPENVEHFLNDKISLAAINGPQQVVFSGDFDAIGNLINNLTDQEINFTQLQTSHAFHSSMFVPMIEDFEKVLKEIKFNKPDIRYVSNLTGNFVKSEEIRTPKYWCNHLLQTVRFSDGLKTIMERGEDLVFVEVGAGNTLGKLLHNNFPNKDRLQFVNMVRSYRETVNDVRYWTEGIGKLWATGIELNWDAYYEGEKRKKVSMPTYAFEELPYPTEVDPFDLKLIPSLGFDHHTTGKELKDWLYFPSWKKAVPNQFNLEHTKSNYLFFSCGQEFINPIKKELESFGNLVVEVIIGNGFHKISATTYIVNPNNQDDYHALMQELKSDHIMIDKVVYSWPMAISNAELVLESNEPNVILGYFGICWIMQALQKNNQLNDGSIFILTDSLHKVLGIERGAALQAIVLGLVNVIPQEYNIPCRNIDIDIASDLEELTSYLLQELEQGCANERIVAYRNGHKWSPHYEKNQLPMKGTLDAIKLSGTYLITGGLGNIGYILATYLIKNYNATVILTGRNKLTGGSGEAGTNIKADRYRYLKELNEKTTYIDVDISNHGEFQKAIEDVELRFGRIDGLIHTAGVLDHDSFELIEETTVTNVLKVFTPKLEGINNIYKIFKNRAPDFVWITSSISALLGGISYAAYASANAFMEQFVNTPSFKLHNWKCISLGEVLFAEDERAKGAVGILPDELTELFKWSLNVKDSPVILATTSDLFTRIQRAYGVRTEEAKVEDDEHRSEDKLDRSKLRTAFVEAETETENELTEIFEGFFGISPIGINDDFFELGGDSLRGMILLKRIKTELKINLTLKEFLSNVTIHGIAEKIDEMKWFSTEGLETDNGIII